MFTAAEVSSLKLITHITHCTLSLGSIDTVLSVVYLRKVYNDGRLNGSIKQINVSVYKQFCRHPALQAILSDSDTYAMVYVFACL